MGLPLFGVKTETEQSRKCPAKASSTLNSGIRRAYRDDSQDRRHSLRRAASRLYGAGAREGHPTIPDTPTRWLEQAAAGLSNSTGPSRRPMREALREFGRYESGRGESTRRPIIPDQLGEIFGPPTWPEATHSRQTPHDDSYETDLGWWSIESGNAARNARMLSSNFPPQPRIADAVSQRRSRHGAPTSDVEAARLRAIADVGASQRRTGASAASRSRESRTRGVDGLGDRERSLSPEGWDTLLSTLTPDPQAPSANSSFASGAQTQGASQGNGAVSEPVAGAAGLRGDSLLDGPCDYENSDGERIDYEHPDYARIRRRREERRLNRSRVPDFNLDGPGDRDIGFGLRVLGGIDNRRGTGNARLTGRSRQDTDEIPGPQVTNNSSSDDASTLRNGWVGRFLIGVAEGREPEPSSVPQPEGNEAPSSNARSDEDWVGMQRIVRRLAHRQDIPDEWWAEVGLSRNVVNYEPSQAS